MKKFWKKYAHTPSTKILLPALYLYTHHHDTHTTTLSTTKAREKSSLDDDSKYSKSILEC
jgi:hypothetical protein